MIKIGLTRRLDPTERVRELGDASVPFKYDTHALVFSDDAVGLEAQMHTRLADLRVNRINKRREFFYATPALSQATSACTPRRPLQFIEIPEAIEYRQSVNEAEAAGGPAAAAVQMPLREAATSMHLSIADVGTPIADEDAPAASLFATLPFSRESGESQA